MIQVKTFQQSISLKEHLKNFDPQTDTWVVSDLHTKIQVQNDLLQKYGYYREDAVLRASDFWKLIFKRNYPQIRIINDQLLKVLLRDILKNRSAELSDLSAQSEKTLLAYLNSFPGVLLHPTGFNQIREWLKDFPESAQKWENWLLISRICMFLLLDEKKVISPRWIPGLLQRDLEINLKWNKNLIFDLGCHLNFAEAEVIKKMSSDNDIRVLKPQYEWTDEYDYLLKPYDQLLTFAETKTEKKLSPQRPLTSAGGKLFVHRLATQLAEVKWAVSQTREWLDQKVELADILICAPDIESYWPALKYYFELEGIPVQKAVVVKLQEVPAVSHWLSTLRTRIRQLKAGDLEATVFSKAELGLSYERFRSLFSKLYGSEDLERHSAVFQSVQNSFIKKSRWNSQEFMTVALKDWSSQSFECLEIILKEVLANSQKHFTLGAEEWIYYLENICAQKELTNKEPSQNGIECLKIQSALSQQQNYRICLGLAEEEFKSQQLLHLSQLDYFNLSKDLGFVIENPELSHLEFDFRVFLSSAFKELYLTFAETDFNGAFLNPSQLWLKAESFQGLRPLEDFNTRADEIAKAWNLEKATPKIKRDLGLESPEAVRAPLQKTISPSKLDDYYKCQFIFSAKNIFRLEDEPLVDLDLDHRTRGVFAHGLFEKLLTKPLRQDWQPAEIEEILEGIVAENSIVFADQRIWKALKKRQVQLAYRFLRFEKEQQDAITSKNFESLKEHDLLLYFDPESLAILPEQTEEAWTLKCRIDRIDQDQSQAVIYDYKSSVSSASSQGEWLKKKKLQLLFYCWAFEHQNKHQSEVIGFFYYIFKPFKISGFGLEDKKGFLGPMPGRAKKANTEDLKLQLLTEFESSLKEALKGISSGLYIAKPLDPLECPQCKWKGLCRAPHLL